MAPSQLDSDADANDVGAAEPGSPGDGMAGDTAGSAVVGPLTRIRVLTFGAVGPLVTGYAGVAALLALVTAVAPGAHFSTSGVLAAALPGWLAAHQVPVSLSGLELGVLPLLPTIGVVVLVARTAAGTAERLGMDRPAHAGQVLAVIAGAHGVCGLVVALVCAGRGGEVVGVDPLAAVYYPALVAAFAATVGVARRCGLIRAVLDRADDVAVAGLRVGLFAVVLLLTGAAAVLTAALLVSAPTARELFATNAPGWGSGVGMLLLSVGYLPNAVVAATSFVTGSGFSLGMIAVSPTDFTGGEVPGLPLLAALPEQQANWWPVVLLLPLAIGVLVGWRLRDTVSEPMGRMRAVAIAAGVVALTFAILAGSAGGRLGIGPFDPLSMRAAGLSVGLMLWIAVPGACTAWFAGPRPASTPAPGLIPSDDDPAPDTDPAPDEPTDQAPDDEPAPDDTPAS